MFRLSWKITSPKRSLWVGFAERLWGLALFKNPREEGISKTSRRRKSAGLEMLPSAIAEGSFSLWRISNILTIMSFWVMEWKLISFFGWCYKARFSNSNCFWIEISPIFPSSIPQVLAVLFALPLVLLAYFPFLFECSCVGLTTLIRSFLFGVIV